MIKKIEKQKPFRQLKVIVGCECSGIVRDSFRLLGHMAMSCDMKPTERPGPHYEGDIRDVLSDKSVEMWDIFICHPPCTYITSLAARWMKRHPYEVQQGLWFVRYLMDSEKNPIPHWCIENPTGLINTKIAKPSQTINPWQFGESISKRTCLWLKELPKLESTKVVLKGETYDLHKKKLVATCGGGFVQETYIEKRSVWFEKAGNGVKRSRTFVGIATAMAKQWSEYVINCNVANE
jgi:hypothetical protein